MEGKVLLLLLSFSASILTPRIVSSQCSSPSEEEVKLGLTSVVEAFLLTEGAALESVEVHNFNIVCYAMKGLHQYDSVSVVTDFTVVKTGSSSSAIYQFQMVCDEDLGWVDNGEGYLTVDESYLTLEPRHDCFLCSYFKSDDNKQLCKACSTECAAWGAGSCLNSIDDCCPYFEPTEGNCVDNCTTVHVNFNPNSTTHICECTLECSIGTSVDTSCSDCIPSSICLTNDPCKNGATCVIGSTADDYQCSCVGFNTGKNCDDCSLVCENGKPSDNCSACICDPGYFSQGLSCNEVKLCDPNPCLNGGTCTERPGHEYLCECPANFIGFNCSSCQDGFGFVGGDCSICRDDHCGNCSGDATNCTSCSNGYKFDVSHQCIREGFSTESLTWIIVGSILGTLLLSIIFCLVLLGLYKYASQINYKTTLKNTFENAGSAVTVNPLYISEEELLKI